jgi:hypothetical protein
VRIFTTKEFARFARREGLSDEALCDAIDRAERGLIDADLGGNLIKQRVARPGQGRSGGYRTVIVWRAGQHCFFVYGFAKSRKADLAPKELVAYRRIGGLLLGYDNNAIERAVTARELVELTCDG